MIIEGLITSTDADDNVNVAPMGPIVHGDFNSLTLRPWSGSTTYQNLVTTKRGIFHVVDTVELIAEAAIRQLKMLPPMTPATSISGFVLEDCCRWFEFEVTETDTTQERAEMTASVVFAGERRPFRGFNRARHAIIEAAILATRLHILPRVEIETAMEFLTPTVAKTGGPDELSSFRRLTEYIDCFYRKIHEGQST